MMSYNRNLFEDPKDFECPGLAEKGCPCLHSCYAGRHWKAEAKADHDHDYPDEEW